MDILVNLKSGKERNHQRYSWLFEPNYGEHGGSLGGHHDKERTVKRIIRSVWHHGITSVIRYTKKFDEVKLSQNEVKISSSELKSALKSLPRKDRTALEHAANNIRDFHSRHLPKSWTEKEIRKGAELGQRITPIERVGVYVPGGKAFYPSSVLMNIIPAVVAGCKEIVMVSPPSYRDPIHQDNKGTIHPAVLAAAKIAGATSVFRIGGAQSIAALAYGANPVPKVDKIVGPGNAYVACAKRLVTNYVDIDKEAGPSEVIVVADSTADPRVCAADLIAQAEHDFDAISILLTPEEDLANAVHASLLKQLQAHSRLEASDALEHNGAIIITKSMNHALELVNKRAPEHLALIVSNPKTLLKKVNNAGAVFLGRWSPVTVGDYYAGPNHVLPTGRRARSSSPLRTEDFQKVTSVIKYTRKRLKEEADDIGRLAVLEGLIGHKRAVDVRLEDR